MIPFPVQIARILCLALLVAQLALAQTGALLEKDQHVSQRFDHAMVTAGEPLATRVGAQILRDGGNAVDSATAVGLALAVTLPRAGNLGGGGFSLILDRDGGVHALDFRETAPAALHRDYYLQDRVSSQRGPTASGVPGTVAGLYAMHRKFGVLPWKKVVEPAQRLASEGFPVTPWLEDGLRSKKSFMGDFPSTAKIFYPHGEVPRVGERLVQKDLAQTLNRLAQEGPNDFYRGKTAELIAKGVQEAGGGITTDDLRNYQAKWREPIKGDFRGYTVWSMPPPSSGGIHLVQMLKLMEARPLKAAGHNSARDLHYLIEAMRLAYCDRARFLGDPDFHAVDTERLLSDPYLEQRKKLIQDDRAGDSQSLAPELFKENGQESTETTHFNVVDSSGMAVSLTYTLNFSYGCGFVVPGTGVMLNNEMDDFNAKPGQPNAYGLLGSAANDVEAGKRPLSSMTPTLVTRDGEFYAALGAPGGSRIINGVFQATLNLLGYGLNAQTSVSMPRIHHQWYPDNFFYELGVSADTLENLKKMGHQGVPIYAVAHVLGIVKDEEGYLEAGLDPRRPAYAEGY